jgi:hypothetical protein
MNNFDPYKDFYSGFWQYLQLWIRPPKDENGKIPDDIKEVRTNFLLCWVTIINSIVAIIISLYVLFKLKVF